MIVFLSAFPVSVSGCSPSSDGPPDDAKSCSLADWPDEDPPPRTWWNMPTETTPWPYPLEVWGPGTRIWVADGWSLSTLVDRRSLSTPDQNEPFVCHLAVHTRNAGAGLSFLCLVSPGTDCDPAGSMPHVAIDRSNAFAFSPWVEVRWPLELVGYGGNGVADPVLDEPIVQCYPGSLR